MAKVTIERWVIVAIALLTFSVGLSLGPVFFWMFAGKIGTGYSAFTTSSSAFSETFGALELHCDGVGELEIRRNGASGSLMLGPTEQVIGLYKAANTNVVYAYVQDYGGGNYLANIRRIVLPREDEELGVASMEEVLGNVDLSARMNGRIMDVQKASDDGASVLVQIYSVVTSEDGLESSDTNAWYWYEVETDLLTFDSEVGTQPIR